MTGRKIIFTVFFIISLIGNIPAKGVKTSHQKVYKLNYKYEAPLTAGLFVLNYAGFESLRKKPTLDSLTILQLDANKIWWFDRGATKQDASKRQGAHEFSDLAMNITFLLPALLAIDDEIRKDWFDLLLLYLETEAIGSTFYAWGPTQWTKRKRPMLYNPDVEWGQKLRSGSTDSFFSGHTSFAATATFFAAKVYCDYHPELGKKKWLVYGAASIPPAIVGIYRYKAMKHFPTDIITGFLVGAGVGIAIPELHKIKTPENLDISLVSGGYAGIRLCYTFPVK